MRILLLYYSQSGEAERVAKAITETITAPDLDVSIEALQPKSKYPYPWKNIGNFFDVLPECHWGPLPPLAPLQVDPDQRFDLIILIYQVWFLAPSLPIHSFLKSTEARILRDTKVMTISISRNMWQSAGETIKQLLSKQGARHIDGVVLTHQGPPWATFITTPRALLFGKKDGLWGIFPPAGLGSKELDRVRRFSQAILAQREKLRQSEDEPLLRNQGAVEVDARYLLAERIGHYCFRWWGLVILVFGGRGRPFRRFGVYLFVIFLVCAIPIGIPLTILIRLIFYPIVNRWIIAFTKILQEPSGP